MGVTLFGAALAAYLMGQNAFTIWAPTYLQTAAGLSPVAAGTILSSFWGPASLGLLAAAIVVARVPARLVLLVSSLSGAVLCALLASTSDPHLFFPVTLAFGFTSTCAYKLMLSIGSEQIPSSPPVLVTGLLFVSAVGGTTAPALSGQFVKAFGTHGAMVMAATCYAAALVFVATALLRERLGDASAWTSGRSNGGATGEEAEMIFAPIEPPRRTADCDEARELVRACGIAILTGCDTSREGAREIALRVLAPLDPIVPEPAPIKEGAGNPDRNYPNGTLSSATAVPFQFGHTDGFAYGDAYPDYLFLACARTASDGGGLSYAIDTAAIRDALAASNDPDDAAFLTFLTTVPIEQTEPGFRPSTAPVMGRTAAGRFMTRWTPVQRAPEDASPDERARIEAWLARWNAIERAASFDAPRFLLEPGDTLCIDNYRMLHGRTGFDDTERALWRVWAWTREAAAKPDGMLHSDSRYARR